MIQNAAACLVFNQPKRAHVTPLLIELHWLPVAARIKFVTYACLQSDCWFCSNLPKCSCKGKCYTRMLRSSSERSLALPSVQVWQSRLFSFVVPHGWNELPSTTRAGASLSIFKKLLKTQLFREHFPP